MKQKTKLQIFFALIFIAILFDAVTTFTAVIKFKDAGMDLESNPLINSMTTLSIAMAIKLLFILLVMVYYSKVYYKTHPFYQYSLVSAMLLLLTLSVLAGINNAKIIGKDIEEVQPLPADQRIEVYNAQVYELDIVKQQTGMPVILFAIFYNFLSFGVWYWLSNYKFKGGNNGSVILN